jgi:2-haloalkanoic acid dehalogenase type II
MPEIPELITFDIFGTVLDWKTGLEAACKAVGRPIVFGEFDHIVDVQGELEQGEFLNYTEITTRSLKQVLGLGHEVAARIGENVGGWPLYADSQASLRALMDVSPCAAMTNSDRAHGEEIQRQLGMRLNDWLCAEETRVYKPNPRFWHVMAERRSIKPSRRWWHVSAYADYDLTVANELDLTTVFVQRSHSRPGVATHSVRGLDELVQLVS